MPFTHDHLSAISAISAINAGWALLLADARGQLRRGSSRRLSARAAAQDPGDAPADLGWSPIHHGQAVKDFLREGAAKRLQLEQLPGYAPDLNPDEGIWNYLKRVELANVCCTDLGDLRHHLLRAGVRLRHKPEVIRACARECGYLV